MAYAEMVARSYDEFPLEACGLLVGTHGVGNGAAVCSSFHGTTNTANSSKVYTVDAKQHLRVELDAEDRGLEVIGVMHSHTHTDAYPSPTDVSQAPDPNWHYVIVSLRQEMPVLRSYRIVDGNILEESVVVVGR